MSLATNFASNTPGERVLYFLRIMHPTWATPLLYGYDTRDWTVTLEDASEATFTATGLDGEAAPADDTGIDSRRLEVPDYDLALWRRLETLARIGSTSPVTVTAYQYLSTNLAAPAAYATLRMSKPTRSNRVVSFEAATLNTVNRDAPALKFTFANSPGLRR